MPLIFAIRSPYLKSEVESPYKFGTWTDKPDKLPPGRKIPMIGSIISFTKAVTNLGAAWPIMNEYYREANNAKSFKKVN